MNIEKVENIMNLKLILFFSIILLILSAGAVSSADLNDTYLSDSTESVDDMVVDSEIENISIDEGDIDTKEPKIIADEELDRKDSNVSESKLDIKGPKNSTPLNISGPKMDGLKIEGPKGSFDDLQAEINHAITGGILNLNRDYVGHYGSRIQFNKDLTINGHGHTLDCGNKGGCSAFYSNSGNIILKNLRIINGHNDYTDKGGAIYIKGSAKYTLENCTFESNWADDYGGAIYNEAENALTIKNCRFLSNKVKDVSGGAIYSCGVVNIENSLFDSNLADEKGGAVYGKKNVNIKNSTFSSNTAKSREWSWYEYIYHWADNPNCHGGAVFSEEDVYIDNSTFKDNTAEDYGGAISAKNVKINTKGDQNSSLSTFFINNAAKDNDGGAVYVSESLTAIDACFKGNTAVVDGGAIFSGDNVDINRCIFESNKAEGAKSSQCYGGAIRAKGDANINNSTFSKNHAEDYGGAVYAKNINVNTKQGDNQTINTFFNDNSAGDNNGGALYCDDDTTVKNARFSGNSAYDSGGGIYGAGTVNAYHCEFINNSALKAINANGGGIFSKSGVNVENSTFKDNYAGSFGPAIYCIKDININQNSNGKDYKSHFINNKAKGVSNKDQIVCDKDHGKIHYKNIVFEE